MEPTTPTENQRTLLGEVVLLCLFISTVYSIIDLFNFDPGVFLSHATLFLGALSCWILIRNGRQKVGRTILLLTIDISLFAINVMEPFATGSFLLFVPAAVGAFVVRDYHQLKRSMVFSSLPVLLFFAAVYGEPLKQLEIFRSESYVRVIFGINFITAAVSSLLVIYFFVRQTSTSEESLKKNEKLLEEKNRELMKVNSELDQFIYRTSHDLRSPLSSIKGLVDIAQRTEDLREIRLCLTLIETRAATQDAFIKEIIEYARNVRTEILNEEFNLSELIYLVIDELMFMDNAENMHFHVNTSDEVSIRGDRFRVKSILINLIENSIKYRDVHKESFVKINVVKEPQQFSIAVTDNGIGIPAELQPKIFDMFFRANDRISGSGLGLFIVKEIVEKLGGTISAVSQQGIGTTFTFRLPLASH